MVLPNRYLSPLLTSALLTMALLSGVHAEEPIRPIPLDIQVDHAKAQLGKRLFFDARLSRDGRVSCASCHDPDQGGAGHGAVSEGVFQRPGAVNAPTVYNAYFNFRQFWNGRARDLQEQATGPMHNPVEMDLTTEEIEARVNADPEYQRAFADLYGGDRAELTQIADAVAEFEKALTTPNAKFDRYLRGETTLAADELAGYLLFKSLGCVTCHNGVNVGGNSYQYLGAVNPVAHRQGNGDLFSRTGDAFDKNRFKVPSLRNVTATAPYLHDGSSKTLRDALEVMAYHNVGYVLGEEEIQQLIAFLGTLEGERPAILGAGAPQ